MLWSCMLKGSSSPWACVYHSPVARHPLITGFLSQLPSLSLTRGWLWHPLGTSQRFSTTPESHLMLPGALFPRFQPCRLVLVPWEQAAEPCCLTPCQMPVSGPFMGSLMAQVTIMTIPGFPGRSPNPCPPHQIRTWPIHSCKVPTLGRCQNTMGKLFPFRLISPTRISVYSPAPQTHCPREATCIAFALFENYLRDYKHKHPFELCVVTSRRTGLHICYSQLNSSF